MIEVLKTECDNRIDVVKGVCIVLMVWGHLPRIGTQAPLLENLVFWIYTFHMPVFVLITGYLFGKKQGEWSEFGMVLNRMLKPYLFGAVTSMSLYWVAARLGVGTTTEHEFTDFWQIINSILRGRCGAIWYLWAFGCVELAVLFALRYGMRIVRRDCLLWVVAMVSVVVVVLAGYQFNFHVTCVPFFFIGFILRRCNIPLPCSWLFIMPIVILLACRESVSIGTFANYIWVISILGFLMWISGLFQHIRGGGGGILESIHSQFYYFIASFQLAFVRYRLMY